MFELVQKKSRSVSAVKKLNNGKTRNLFFLLLSSLARHCLIFLSFFNFSALNEADVVLLSS